MRTYDEAFAAAKDERPFSNGTEGYAWMETWCEECVNDSPELVDQGQGCPLIMVALMQRTPAEWIEQPWVQIKGRPEGETAPVLGDKYHCTEFRGPDDDRGPSWPPPPEDPDQITIFDEFVDQAVEQFQTTEPARAGAS